MHDVLQIDFRHHYDCVNIQRTHSQLLYHIDDEDEKNDDDGNIEDMFEDYENYDDEDQFYG